VEHNLRPPRDADSTPLAQHGKNPDRRLWLLLGVVLAALLVVLLVLPAIVTEPVFSPRATVAEPEQKAAREDLPELAQSVQFRIDAEQALQDFLRLQAQPGLGNAELWANDGWSLAMNSAARGDDEFGQGRFAPALRAYQEAGTQLQTLLDDREHRLQQNMESGWQHLQDNAVKEAELAFDHVIAMQPDHQQAQLGLERAAVRMQVLEFVLHAEQAEVSSNLPPAAQAYASALQLDPLYTPAREALAKIEIELQDRNFQDSMGRALQAIDSGDFTAAEQALLESARINPGNPAIKDADERLLSARRQASLNSLRRQAEQHVKSEDWAAAAERYHRALAIDSQAAFARTGLDRAREKQQLHKQLDHYLADTTRLYSDDPLDNARKLLVANQQASDNEPLLAGKLASLQQAVTLAVTPVELIILSDKLTEVTIYKVGRLGSFEQKQLSLRPGKYTVTGSRQGYRDVLKEIELKPGGTGQTLKINAEEQI